jgi:alpha-1,3-rhamnosyltransferase
VKNEGAFLNALHSKSDQAARPLVSVVVPVYNHERFVGATIRSLIAQSYQNLELIVVDDGSSDGSIEIIRALAQDCQSRFARFVLFEQSNSGIAATLNRGIAASKGSLLLWLASDDLANPDAVATLVPVLLQDPEVGLACGDADYIDALGQSITKKRRGRHFTSLVHSFVAGKKDFNLETDFGSYRSLIDSFYVSIGCLVRRSHFLEAGYFDTSYITEDCELWLRLSKICRFKFVDRTLFHRRLHAANTHRRMRERVSLDSLRLMLREARYCMSNGLADQWQESIEERLELYNRRLLKGRAKRVEKASKSRSRRLLRRLSGFAWGAISPHFATSRKN